MTDPIVFQSQSPRLQLPFLFAGQAQKEFFVNEALARIDLMLHPTVEGERTDPPSSPEDGESWIVGESATGIWSGMDGRLAGYVAGDWAFADPVEGMRVWDRETGQSIVFAGGWQRVSAPALPGGGSTVDEEARTAIVNLIETLRNAGIFSAS